MATDYVDAGQAVGNSTLSKIVGKAPPVAKGVTYERILDARSEPHNWLTYYGAYDGQRYSPLDQINASNVKDLLDTDALGRGAALPCPSTLHSIMVLRIF
jgi:alcohol dehydrogenase (cytochrome c)